MARQELKDWVIMFHVGLAVNALLVLAFWKPDGAIVAAVCAAVPTILGLFHWFTLWDDKHEDRG